MNASNIITPTDLRDFLKAQGWVLRSEGVAHRLYVLEHPAFDRRQLVFPMSTDAVDYDEAVDLVLSKLAELVGKPKSTILAQAQAIPCHK